MPVKSDYLLSQFIFCSLVVFLSGCVSKVSSIKVDADLPLEEGEGYLLMSVETNVQLQSLSILGEENVKLTENDLKKGSNYILIDLPSGDYKISKVTKSHWYSHSYVKLDEKYWSFQIKPNVVSYIGHLNVKSNYWMTEGYFVLNNKSSYALEFMEQQFPNILEKRTLAYQGPGKDDFLNYINATRIQGEKK